MTLPSSDTPLYNHPLFAIEKWLENLGCQQDAKELNQWRIEKRTWQAEIYLDVEELTVRYLKADSQKTDIVRAFKYSLTREDVESAVFSGP